MKRVLINNVHYELYNNKTAKIIGFRNEEAIIPDVLEFKGDTYYIDKIKSIHDYGSLDLEKTIKQINIPDTVKILDTRAFYHVKADKITIGSGVTVLPEYCFMGSTIKELTLSEGLIKIDLACFCNCSSLRNVYLPDSLETLGLSSFYGCSDLEEISIPPIKYISNDCFKFCSKLKRIYLRGIWSSRMLNKLLRSCPTKKRNIDIDFYISENNLSNICGKRVRFILCNSIGETYSDLDYKILDNNNCLVTYRLNNKNNNSYSGDIIIPGLVLLEGFIYKVIGIDDFAFYDSNVSSIEVPESMDFENISPFCLDKNDIPIFKRSKKSD